MVHGAKKKRGKFVAPTILKKITISMAGTRHITKSVKSGIGLNFYSVITSSAPRSLARDPSKKEVNFRSRSFP